MEHSQPLPSNLPGTRQWPPEHWIMIDQRLGSRAAAIVAAMPPRSAVIIRPYAMATAGRSSTIRAIVRAAKARRHVILWAGSHPPAFADGKHGGGGGVRQYWRNSQLLTLSVHNAREAQRAARLRADAVLVSPIHATASHPGGTILGRTQARRLAASTRRPAIALGGMNMMRFRRLRGHGFMGWAAIDAWAAKEVSAGQKRKRVPT